MKATGSWCASVKAGGGDSREAIVLAGGRGTRLATVLPNRQKVAAEVRGEAFALRLARWLGAADVDRVVFAAGHRAADIETLVASYTAASPKLIVSVEPEPLGTGGAVALAARRTAADTVLVLNGDSFAEVNLQALYDFHDATGAAATLALARVDDVGRYGAVEARETGEIISFREKLGAAGGAGLINAGVYLFDRKVLNLLPTDRAVSLEQEVFPSLIGAGLYGMAFEGRFIDIGTPESLAAAEAFFESSAA